MRKIIMLIMIATLSCNKTDQKIDYAIALENCFSATEIEILNEACALFESQLIENYPEEPIGIKYQRFLEDIGSLNEPAALIKNTSKTFLTKLNNSSVFDKIWIKYSETYYEDNSYETQTITNLEGDEDKTAITPKDFYITNPKGEYLECLINNQSNKYVNEYLIAVRDIGDLSPQLMAQGLLSSMKDSDYNDKAVRLIIAMNLFYELEFSIAE